VKLRLWPLLAFIALASLAALVPADWLRPLDLIGNAVCHRIPERSFFVAARQLPVCARDTGMFSTALLGLLLFSATLRRPAADFPPRPYAYLFAAFFVAWAFDGFNSYWLLATGQTLIYAPQNWLRLTTGAGMGMALSVYAVALANQAIWRAPERVPVVNSWTDVMQLVLIAAGVIVVVLWRPNFLFGPIALTSGLGVLVMLTLVNGLLVLIILRRHGSIEHGRQLALPALAGAVLTLIEIGAINLLRAILLGQLG